MSGERVKEVPDGCFEYTQEENTIFFSPLKTEAAGITQLLVTGALITENSSTLAVKFCLLSTLTILFSVIYSLDVSLLHLNL